MGGAEKRKRGERFSHGEKQIRHVDSIISKGWARESEKSVWGGGGGGGNESSTLFRESRDIFIGYLVASSARALSLARLMDFLSFVPEAPNGVFIVAAVVFLLRC